MLLNEQKNNKISSEFAKTTVGTLYYMAPEVIKGLPYDESCDMYSLGIVML